MPEEIKRIEVQDSAISKRVTDGLSCKKDDECLSDKCEDKICIVRNYEATQFNPTQSDGFNIIQSETYPDVNEPPNIDEKVQVFKVYEHESEDKDKKKLKVQKP